MLQIFRSFWKKISVVFDFKKCSFSILYYVLIRFYYSLYCIEDNDSVLHDLKDPKIKKLVTIRISKLLRIHTYIRDMILKN